MSSPILIDLSHTSHTLARTGVQRVCRSLRRELGDRSAPVTYDPYEGAWRPLEAWEQDNLLSPGTSKGRGARWPLGARVRGHLRRLAGRPDPRRTLALAGGTSGLIVPEIFSPEVASALPTLFVATKGPRVALFHDAIALQYPEFAPKGTVARFPQYLQELLQFDGVAAVSEASRTALLDYWKWLGVTKRPEIVAITLGVDEAPAVSHSPAPATPVVLCVSSIEGRKNHLALLEACESLWSSGLKFQLRLVGLANSETGSNALSRIDRLKSAGRDVRYEGVLSDAALESAYSECLFTVYPSLAEGFGLPVAESLSRGKPCACRIDGALGEIAGPGGCKDLKTASASDIASALGALLSSEAELAALAGAASRRRFKTWTQYAAELLAWVGSVKIVS